MIKTWSLLAIIHVVGIYCLFFGFFAVPSTNVVYNTILHPPMSSYTRLIYFVIDGMRFDHSLSLKWLHSQRNGTKSIHYETYSHPPTVTMPRIKAMTAGIFPQFLDILHNLNSKELIQDSWIRQFSIANRSISLFGDETWLKLFPYFSNADPTSSFLVSDTVEVDSNVTRHLPDVMKGSWDVTILHFLGLDHIGHLGGVTHPLWNSKIEEMNDVVKILGDWVLNRTDTLFIVCSDHGMTNDGNHGGSSEPETSSFMTIIGGDMFSVANDRVIQQMSIVPTISLLFGLPIPHDNAGTVLLECFHPEYHRAALIANIKQIDSKASIVTPGLDDMSEEALKMELLKRQNDIHGGQNVNYFLFLFGVASCFIGSSYFMLLLYYRFYDLKMGIIMVVHLATLFSSSLIEEEYQFWYFATTSSFVYEIVQNGTIRNSLILCLILMRICRGWKQGGIKWQGNPSISSWLTENPRVLELVYMLVLVVFLSRFLRSKRLSINSFLYCGGIMALGMEYPLLVYGFIVLLISSSILSKDRFVFKYAITLLCLLIHKRVNAPLILLISIISQIVRVNPRHQYLVAICSYFYFGYSISLSSIDFSGIYVGITSYDPILLGILVFIVIFTGPILILLDVETDFMTLACGLQSIEIFVYSVVLFAMKDHLFVWSVFSPKFLFVMLTSAFVLIAGLIQKYLPSPTYISIK